MNKGFRKLNKYERAYFNKIQSLHKKRFFEEKKPSLGKKIIYNYYFYKKKILFFLKRNKKVKKTNIISSIKTKTKKDVFIKDKKEEKLPPENKKKEKNNNSKNWISNFYIKTMSDIKKIKKRTAKKKKPKKKKTKGFWIGLKWLLGFFIIGLFVLLGILFVWFSSLEIPNVDNFDKRKISNSTKLYDKTGEILLYDIHENIQRTVVPGDQISQHAKDAIISIEDHSFYEHKGVVWKSTFRAIVQTIASAIGLSSEGSAGGSTLTQQVVKNTLLTNEKTLPRKMKEWVLAYKIENKISKDEILTIYLNEAPYGGTIYGIQEASRVFFGKTASELTVAESAYLASIPNLPTFYSPYGPNKDKLDKRQRVVLLEMKRYGYISDKTYRESLEEVVEFLPQEDNYSKALHFVQYVRALLEEKYGVDIVENGGLKVITTLDYKLQQEAEKIIKEHIEEVEEQYNASNAALVAVESKTGNIITMVGSRDYFDTEEFDGNFNVAIAPRQPGSSFKPFAYGTAFEKGYLPESMIFDVETQFNSSCEREDTTSDDGCYSPNNYDFKYKGIFSFRDALAQSRNIPAIKVLHLAGLHDVIDKTHEMGITSLTENPSYYGLGLVLGGGEVSLLEMVSAYTTFSNEGEHNKLNSILEITDINGEVLEKYQKNEKRVFSKNTARMVSSILSDNVARTPLFGAQSFMYFGSRDVAGKTGTTNDNRDAWLIGYSSDVAVGVWTGNNDNSPMKKGSSISGKPWRSFMDKVLEDYDDEDFKDYELPENFSGLPNMIRGEWFGEKTYYIDSESGKLATEFTPEETKMSVTNFDPHTILHSVRKNNPQEPGNSRTDPQYENWEYAVQKYVQENYQNLYNSEFEIPIEFDDVHNEDTSTEGSFTFDIEGLEEEYGVDGVVEIELDFDDIRLSDIETVLYYVNNSFTGSVENRPFDISFGINDIQYIRDENILKIIAEDEDGKKVTNEEVFNIILPEDFQEEEVVEEVVDN